VSGLRAAVGACLLAAQPLFADGGRAAEVAAWLTGTFEPGDPVSGGAPHPDRIVVVAVPRSRIANGALVLYREEAAAPKIDEPTRQRFYRLEEDGDAVRMRAFDPKDPILVRGKWRDPSDLALYGASDMRERPGCTMRLRKSGDLWKGETAGPDCPSAVRTAVTMTSTLVLAQDGFTEWERGFDGKGRQTWSSPEGGVHFRKISRNAPVDDRLIERPVGRRPEKTPTRVPSQGSAAVKPAASETTSGADFSSKVNEPAPEAPPVLIVASPSSPPRKYSLADLRAIAGTERIRLGRFFEGSPAGPSAAIVVTSRSGAVSLFSSAEISSSPVSLDVSGAVPRLVAAPGRGLEDVVSIELKLLTTNSRQP